MGVRHVANVWWTVGFRIEAYNRTNGVHIRREAWVVKGTDSVWGIIGTSYRTRDRDMQKMGRGSRYL
jgi:hypothetical protein